jgi:type IV pilus assembly protein PilE
MIKWSKGMTLIELMIAVAVVGILSAIAYPSYQNQVRRSNRADAITALTSMANAQERFYLASNTYTTNTTSLGFAAGTGNSQRGFYTLAVPIGDTTTFTITATAVAGRPQASDTGCTALSLTSTGVKTPPTCW